MSKLEKYKVIGPIFADFYDKDGLIKYKNKPIPVGSIMEGEIGLFHICTNIKSARLENEDGWIEVTLNVLQTHFEKLGEKKHAPSKNNVPYSPPYTLNTFGGRLRCARLKKGLSLCELAEKAGVCNASISVWERNDGDPKLFNLICLADVLDVSIDWLTGRDAKFYNRRYGYEA